MKKHKLSDNAEGARMVKEVGVRIQHAVERYFSERGRSHHPSDQSRIDNIRAMLPEALEYYKHKS